MCMVFKFTNQSTANCLINRSPKTVLQMVSIHYCSKVKHSVSCSERMETSHSHHTKGTPTSPNTKKHEHQGLSQFHLKVMTAQHEKDIPSYFIWVPRNVVQSSQCHQQYHHDMSCATQFLLIVGRLKDKMITNCSSSLTPSLWLFHFL